MRVRLTLILLLVFRVRPRPSLTVGLLLFTFALRDSDRAEREDESALESEVAARGVVPLFERVGAAGGSARADCDGGDAARDCDVRVGRGAVEEGLRAYGARRLGGESDERVLGRSLASGAVADEFHFEFERRRARPARGSFVLGRLARGAAKK